MKRHYPCENATDPSELLKCKLINADSGVARETVHSLDHTMGCNAMLTFNNHSRFIPSAERKKKRKERKKGGGGEREKERGPKNSSLMFHL